MVGYETEIVSCMNLLDWIIFSVIIFFLFPTLSDISEMAMKLLSAYEDFKVKGADEEFAFIPPQVSEPVYSCPICSNKDQRVSCLYCISF